MVYELDHHHENINFSCFSNIHLTWSRWHSCRQRLGRGCSRSPPPPCMTTPGLPQNSPETNNHEKVSWEIKESQLHHHHHFHEDFAHRFSHGGARLLLHSGTFCLLLLSFTSFVIINIVISSEFFHTYHQSYCHVMLIIIITNWRSTWHSATCVLTCVFLLIPIRSLRQFEECMKVYIFLIMTTTSLRCVNLDTCTDPPKQSHWSLP